MRRPLIERADARDFDDALAIASLVRAARDGSPLPDLGRACARRRPGPQHGGARGIGGGAPRVYLLDPEGGSFTRNAITYAQTSAAAVAEVAVNTRAYEDLGTAEGRLISLEEQWTQLIQNPRDMAGTGWTAKGGSATYTANAGNGPDGSATADRNNFGSGGVNTYSQYQTVSGLTTLSPYTCSFWIRATSGTSAQQSTWFRSTSVGQRDYQASIGETWQRRQMTDVGAGTTLSLIVAEGRLISGLSTIVTASDVLSDLHNARAGRYALRSSAISNGVVAPDDLSYAEGEWDTRLATAEWSIYVYPKWATTDLVSGDERWILSYGGANDGVRFRHDGTGVKVEVVDGGSVVCASQYIGSIAKHGEHRITIDVPNGTVTHNDTSGAAGAALTLPTTGALRWGGIHGAAAGSGKEVSARCARPFLGAR
jgi:hypothetical protein